MKRSPGWAAGLLAVACVAAATAGAEAAECAFATTVQQPAAELPEEALVLRRPRVGRFRITTIAGSTFAGNAAAVAAFARAVAAWEAVIADPVTILLDVDFSASIPSGTIGTNNAVGVGNSWRVVRNLLQNDATSNDDAIAASIPGSGSVSFNLPPAAGWSVTGNVYLTKANMKALGVSGLDDMFGNADAVMRFNSQFTFDYDRSDGITPGAQDFESVALHEIGHALGFTSAVDTVDTASSPGAVNPTTLDVFRFTDGGADDPSTALEFETFARSLAPNTPDSFDDSVVEFAMSTGRTVGDGRQASHWKDDSLLGFRLGVMDPTLASGEIFSLTSADLRAFDLIGWDIVEPVPPLCDVVPSASCTTGAAGKSSLQVKNKAAEGKDSLRWKLKQGDATALADFKDPVGGSADYRVCLYDSSARPQPILETAFYAGGACDGKPCWELSSGGDRYRFKDKSGLPEGIEGIELESGSAGDASIAIKAKDERFESPALVLTMPVTIQLLADDGSRACWETVFSGTPKKNSSEEFQATGP